MCMYVDLRPLHVDAEPAQSVTQQDKEGDGSDELPPEIDDGGDDAGFDDDEVEGRHCSGEKVDEVR